MLQGIWNVRGNCQNTSTLTGHTGTVLDIKWDSPLNQDILISASTDKTVSLWDTQKGVRVRKYKQHQQIVNSVSFCKKHPELFASVSDDRSLHVTLARVICVFTTIFRFTICEANT